MVTRIREGSVRNALIVGAGFIEVEIAILLNHLGIAVTILMMADRIMPRMLDQETSAIIVRLMQEKGLDVRLKSRALAFQGRNRVERVELESGESLHADLYIAATGVKPNTEFLKDSGVQVNWGVTVDSHLGTNEPDVYAAGGVAEVADRITGIPSVHPIFPNAIVQGRGLAHNLLGWNVPYEGAESMNSLKHLGIPLIAAGVRDGEELRLRKGGALRNLYVKRDAIVGFQLAGDIRGAGIYRTLMNKKVDIGPIRERLSIPVRHRVYPGSKCNDPSGRF